MFNLDGLIIPGKSAAGIMLGQVINEILNYQNPTDVVELIGCYKYQFDSVNLWVENEKITQIGVFANYRGKLQQEIGIGSTIEEVQNLIGRVEENDDDCLVVAGMSGWSFETEEWDESHQLQQNLTAKIVDIFVF